MTGLELALSIALATTTATDVHSTLRIPNRIELNPIMKPFAGSGSRLIPMQSGVSMVVIMGSRHLKQQGNKRWWVPLVIGIGAHAFATVHNSQQKK